VIDLNIYSGKRVLVTGHTGFKGTWLSQILIEAGADVYGISLKPEKNSLFTLVPKLKLKKSVYLNINNAKKLDKAIHKIDPHLVFHLAAQPLVRKSYKDPIETFQTNVMGTVNTLDASLKGSSITGIVAITTDKVYKNLENLDGYQEEDPLGGTDPYSASKSASEMVITAWQNISKLNSGVPIVAARSGNVIGGGDRAEDRLIPDLIRSFRNKTKAQIRNPNSIRPWQHVLDPLNGYLIIGSKLLNGKATSKSYNFGPSLNSKLTVSQMADEACSNWPNNNGWEIQDQNNSFPESKLLLLSSQKAKEELAWENKLSAKEAVEWTIDWESNLSKNNALDLISSQIKKFKAIKS
jgi:CDP-glucose 4,6-dehydratase